MNQSTPISDQNLIRALRNGKEDAFTAIYSQCSGPVYRFALYMTDDAHAAEEVTQDTFLFLLSNTASFDPTRGSLLSWLLGIARNHSRRLRLLITNDCNDLADNDLPGPDAFEHYAQNEQVDALRRAIASLPSSLREVVLLCELQELEYQEAAAILNCPIGTVRSRLHRARALLTSKLQNRCPVV